MELLSEEEQWEQLKRWLRENGPSILVMVIVGLLAVAGWRWWQGRGEQSKIAAGVAYENVLKTFDAGKVEEALAQIEAAAQGLSQVRLCRFGRSGRRARVRGAQ